MKSSGITIIGTSHIAKESIDEITSTFIRLQPEIVAVELDRNRLYALVSKAKHNIKFKDIRVIGLKGYLFALIGSYVQKKLGKYVKTSPGSDMLVAVKLAKKHKSRLALIDQDISKTLRRFSESLTWKEKWNFVVDVFNAIFFRKREMKKLGISNLDLTKVPTTALIKKLLKKAKHRYPNVYNVLVDERNIYMADQLNKIHERHPGKKILAVVGAGHVEGISKLIMKKDEQVSYSFSIKL